MDSVLVTVRSSAKSDTKTNISSLLKEKLVSAIRAFSAVQVSRMIYDMNYSNCTILDKERFK